MIFRHKPERVTADAALPGRTDQTMPVPEQHFVLGTPLTAPWPDGTQIAVFGLGCFWGAERKFWQTEGVYSTCLLYTSDAADERSSVDLGGRRIITKKNKSEELDARR